MFTAQELKSLNELEMLVYQYVTEHRSAVPYMRIRELATEAHVSTTTVLHFCKKMGCEGFSQFKWKLKEENGMLRILMQPQQMQLFPKVKRN